MNTFLRNFDWSSLRHKIFDGLIIFTARYSLKENSDLTFASYGLEYLIAK